MESLKQMSLGGVASFAITLLSWGQAVARRAASSASDHAEDIGTRGDADGTPTAELMAVAVGFHAPYSNSGNYRTAREAIDNFFINFDHTSDDADCSRVRGNERQKQQSGAEWEETGEQEGHGLRCRRIIWRP